MLFLNKWFSSKAINLGKSFFLRFLCGTGEDSLLVSGLELLPFVGPFIVGGWLTWLHVGGAGGAVPVVSLSISCVIDLCNWEESKPIEHTRHCIR